MTEPKDKLNPDHSQEDAADRGMPSISRKGKAGGIGQKIILGAIVALTILALIAVNGGFSKDDEDQTSSQNRSSKEIGNRLGPAPAPPPPPAAEQEKSPEKKLNTGDLGRQAPASKRDENTPEQRKLTGGVLLSGKRNNPSNQNQLSATEQASLATGEDQAEGLGASLKPTTVDGARASILTDPSMFITRGTYLDCALETAISSDQPGMTSCRMTRDVYSTNGKVLLLERGSRITGQYQSGMERGQARIFVLWTRIETPNGVIVNLDSPGTDALGRSGHTGYVDTHFWTRFGAAIMFSLLDDVGNYASNLARNDDGDTITFGNTSDTTTDMAGIALENSINIPPTLLKNQGEHINVFVARDLDFRGVYDLKASR